MEYIITSIHNYNEEKIKSFYDDIYEEKKKRIDKYVHAHKKKTSIIGEILLDSLFKKHGLDYHNLDFKTNIHGKPYIKNNIVFFNISHSYEYVIASISHKKIGIDIEKIRDTKKSSINQFATENEKKYILQSKENIEERIFKVFTLKEAYFKMKGTNLNNALEVEFTIDKNNVICSDKSVKAGLINDVHGYVIAYCEKI